MAFLSAYSLVHPDHRFLVLVPKVREPCLVGLGRPATALLLLLLRRRRLLLLLRRRRRRLLG